MQVYLLTWDGQQSATEAFRNFADIEPSIKISFSQATELQVVCSPRETSGPKFTVTGKMNGEPFTETLYVKRLSVYDSPTHL